MQTHGGVVHAPSLDQHRCFRERVEDLCIEQLVAQLAVEESYIAVLLRTAGLDECRRDAAADPAPDRT